MDEKNEIGALAKMAHGAYMEGNASTGRWKRVAVAVRDTVLSSLAARGSGQFVEVCALTQEWLDKGGPIPNEVARQFMSGVRAKAATIAALQQRVEALNTISSALQQRAEQAERERDAWRAAEALSSQRWQRAESALATLQLAVEPVVDFLRRSLEVRGTPQGPMVTAGQARVLLAAYAATPAPEHSDTAKNGVRDVDTIRRVLRFVGGPDARRVANALAVSLDDSGPSGGGETRCPSCHDYRHVGRCNPLDATAPSLAACVDCGQKNEGGHVIYVCDADAGGCGKEVCSSCSENAGPNGNSVMCVKCYEELHPGLAACVPMESDDSGETRCQHGNEGGPCKQPPLANGWCRGHQHIGAMWGAEPVEDLREGMADERTVFEVAASINSGSEPGFMDVQAEEMRERCAQQALRHTDVVSAADGIRALPAKLPKP